MNWEQVEGQWKDIKGQLRTEWGKLTDDDLEATKGRRDRIIGKILERYGEAKESIGQKLDRFIDNL